MTINILKSLKKKSAGTEKRGIKLLDLFDENSAEGKRVLKKIIQDSSDDQRKVLDYKAQRIN